MIKNTFPNEQALQDALEKIRTKNNSNREITRVSALISYNSTLWKIKHLSDKVKLHCPTLFFRSIYTKQQTHGELWNIWSEEEPKINPGGKYIFYLNAPHYLWHDKKCSDDIIKHIKESLTIYF